MSNESDKPEKKEDNLSPEIVQKFVETQEKELEIRQKELEQRKKESEYDYELAKQSIEVQERDRKDHRDYFRGHQRRRYTFIGILAFLAILFLGYALWMGESNLSMKIIEIASYIIAGGLGGYAIGYSKAKQEVSTED